MGIAICEVSQTYALPQGEEARRSIRTSWGAFGRIVTMFGLIALVG